MFFHVVVGKTDKKMTISVLFLHFLVIPKKEEKKEEELHHMSFTNVHRFLLNPNNALLIVLWRDLKLTLGDDCISIVSNSSRIRIRNIICGPGHGIR